MIDLDIIFEDMNSIVINKPSGLLVHSDGRSKEMTLSDILLKKYPSIENIGEVLVIDGQNIPRHGIVHRLDKETSGVMIIAKTNEMFSYLKKEFRDRNIIKEYHAFVLGNFNKKRGSITEPIGTSRNDFRQKTSINPRGNLKDAHTEYVVDREINGISFVKFFPKTGRTHQIRVHSKLTGHPVVCDKLYAPKKDCILDFKRLALHSSKLTLHLPGTEERTFTSAYPKDFRDAINLFDDLESQEE